MDHWPVDDKIVGLLMAAGHSRRFGSDKLLAPLPDGVSVARTSARNLKRALPNCIAVIRPDETELEAHLHAEGMRVISCPDAHNGLGHSLAYAIRASENANAWVIALGDMPCIKTETLRQVADKLRQGAQIVAPVFQGKRGHPVGICARFRSQLAGLQGDMGARELIRDHAGLLETFDCADPGTILDVDVPADLSTIGESLITRCQPQTR